MSLHELQVALDEGRTSDLRAILVGLDAKERELLKAEVGEESYEQIFAAAARRARGAKRGRVILLHGIMGADLSVRKGRSTDPVWIDYWSLFRGRIRDMQLRLDGTPRDRDVEVLVRGQNKKYYLPPLLELANHWHARPFAYDWRLDIRKSADRLAELVEGFGQGQPVHLVAHSMGGLVSRCFIQRHPELWAKCDDPNGHASGGRLLMLGTPNHGSYTIPLVLTGDESKIKGLALIDVTNSMADILKVVDTFPGSYQMLPSSPFEDSTDDRAKLYDGDTWGNLPVREQLLEDARRFHESLRPVVDAERFLYVAGTDQKTPAAVRVRGRKDLRYAYTNAGDGRVPHALGLLPGVRTYYVNQAHGNLPIDKAVLGAIHELLRTGQTTKLETVPSVRRGGLGDFEEPSEEVPTELAALAAKDTGRGARAKTRLTPEEQRRVAGLLLDDTPAVRGKGASGRPKETPRSGAGKRGKPAALKIDVVWGDVTAVQADVYAVGHYQGVLPQNAEWALDRALSDTDDPNEQVLRQHTQRGHLRGALGDIDLFPWPKGAQGRAVAVAGMGAPGSFSPEALRFLVRKLVWVVVNQPGASTIATVLIGSGVGTLGVREAVHSYLAGIREALEHGDVPGGSYRLRIVELYRDKAEQVLAALKQAKQDGLLDELPNLTVSGRLGVTPGRGMRPEDAFRTLARAVGKDTARGAARKHFDGLLRSVKRREPRLAQALDSALQRFVEKSARDPEEEHGNGFREPIRMSFSMDQGGIRVAAISSTTTVSERILRFDPSLLEELIQEISDEEDASVESNSSFVTRLLLPAEFRDWIATKGGGPFVFDVDREMARVHWEMLESGFTPEGEREPLATMAIVARQLRTTYSAPSAQPLKKRGPLRVLVVGDPGDPEVGDDLPGAQEEALEVAGFLAGLPNVEVVTRIGAPGGRRTGALRAHKPARRLDVLKELVTGNYDILHYCGHGDFDPDDGERAGWVFSEGLITSREIARVESPPPLVVANACLSARTSQAVGSISKRHLESKLLPSLADEFFRRGVRNYVGTAWTVSDLGAVLFAQTFYGALLRPQGADQESASGDSSSIGAAVLAARRELYRARDTFGGLWSAYQHYGDPNSIVRR